MILNFDELKNYRSKVAMVDGGFDPIHAGHVLYFNEAARQSEYPLLCNVSSDEYLKTKHQPLLPQSERAAVIDSFCSIEYVHLSTTSTEEVLEQLRPAVYIKGKDWEGRLPEKQLQICEKYNIEIIFLDTVTGSSSQIIQDILKKKSIADQVSEFENFVHTQDTTGSDDYDDNYFHDTWRDGSNDYTIETRRRIEGRNPQLIKDVFKPKNVVDMGCGPGAMMFLLHELGIDVDGVDFAESSKKLAPPEVVGNINIGSVTSVDLPANSYDLVICREVFEHLSVLQVQQAVQNFARITSKYVYLTTRFHPEPESLLDVTTEFEVDPTHITCLNIEYLRLLFVMQGMKRRLDLEAKMDWLNKGRVLVYEKI